MRMDMLTKFYRVRAIKKFCVGHKKDFVQLTQKDLGSMKLATAIKENWLTLKIP
jgi:hypothetical protein